MNAAPIVLIDDDHSWLQALAEYLERKGFSVLAAADPAQGLALLGKNNVSMVICDYDMPGMTGLDLVGWIRQQPRNIPVLMVSNEEEPSLPDRALAAGVRGFLAKTVAPAQLVRKLWQILADVDDASAHASPLHLWQRLLPGPQKGGRGRSKNRPAARSGRALSKKSIRLPC